MATTSQKAPEVQKIGDIVNELNPAFKPGIDLAQEEMALINPQLDADIKGAEQAKVNEFRNITNLANRRGMTFSGIPVGEQARYIGEKFLPAVQTLKTGAQKERIRIRDIIAGINRDAYMQAYGERGKQKDQLFQYQRDEAGREYGTSERIAGQEYGTSERIAGQQYGTSERIAGQNFTASENLLARQHTEKLQTQQIQASAAASRSSGGGGGGGSSSSKPSQWQVNMGAVGAMAQQFAGSDDLTWNGADGYVSPETYNSSRSDWQSAGMDVRIFDENFSYLANPSHNWDYSGQK